MSNHIVTVTEDNSSVTVVHLPDSIEYRCDESDVSYIEVIDSQEIETVHVVDLGPQGSKGDKGDTGASGISEPFYIITAGTQYGTTGSLAIYSDFSSSLTPMTQSTGYSQFSLVEVGHPWGGIYLYTGSTIHFVENGTTYVSVTGGSNFISIGSSKIETASYGFETSVISRRDAVNTDITLTGSLSADSDGETDPLSVTSASFEAWRVDSGSVVVYGEFTQTPTPVMGGLIAYDGNFYMGV